MSTNQYYKKYASSGSYQPSQLDDGLRAMQQQTQTQIDGIRTRGEQVTQQRNEHMKALDRKAKNEANNRARLYQLDLDIEKIRQTNIDISHKSQIDSLQKEAKYYENRAKMWAQLTPTLSQNFQKMATDIKGYLDTKNAMEEFREFEANGGVGTMNTIYALATKEADMIGIANERHQAYKDAAAGDLDAKQRLDYLTNIDRTRNPITQDMVARQVTKDFAGIEIDMLSWFEENEIPVTANTVLNLYSFRGMEILREYNISPKSRLGFEILRLFEARGRTKETQLGLQDDYKKFGEEVGNGVDKLQTLNKAHVVTDFPTKAAYDAAVQAQDERKNAIWIDIVTSLNAMPVYTKNGYIKQVQPNTRDNIVNFAKDHIKHYKHLDAFLSDFFGVTERNPLGYIIPGADRNSKKKTDRIFGKFPRLREEMAEIFYDGYDEAEKERERLNDNRQREVASKYQEKLDSGYYKNNIDEFWNDWESMNGNPHARKVFAGSLGYMSKNINEDTLTSTIVQNYKAGNMKNVYSAWAGLSDAKQEIGLIVKDLQELATNQGVEVTKLDDTILNVVRSKIDLLIQRDNIDKTKHPTAEEKDIEALAFLLEHFRTNNVGTVFDRFEQAKAALDAKLGIVNGTPQPYDENGLRGSGEFLQKQGKSGATNQAIFVKDAGENFGNITGLEIELSLEDTTGRNRLEKLKRIVTDDLTSNNPRVSDQDIADLLRDGTTSNRLLNHLMKKENLKTVTKTDFINSIKQTVDNTLIKQWGGEDWCNHILGAYSGNLTQDQQAIGVCARAIEHQFDTPAWEFLINPSLRDRLQR